ncbi:hypothetical protein LSH36_1009g01006 [Paralvinella palmiformis]|uniref:Uncharacterized protein n=1 Tax=Paralvinella palmiformis TaxID=53620 RepID=A0AAD9IWS1_9ANNE|nr:hypothetical protein LSH36_1009g01006 [Paralvinella palmiformis]
MKGTSQVLLSSAVTLLMMIQVFGVDGSSIAASAPSDVQTKKEILFLAKIVAPLREIAREAEQLASLVERVAAEGDLGLELAKRQGAWDMDYGWGGGRFGKRGSGTSTSQSGKRYDSFGIAGRFGRSVENAEGH